jgi:hypothetical protein
MFQQARHHEVHNEKVGNLILLSIYKCTYPQARDLQVRNEEVGNLVSHYLY